MLDDMEEDKQTKITDEKVIDEVIINVDGISNESGFEKVLVKEGEHNGDFTSFTSQVTMKYGSTTEKELQIIATVALDSGEGELPLFIKPKITKSWKEGFSNSKLYDILELSGDLEAAVAKSKDLVTVGSLVYFLENALLGAKIRFSTKTVNKGKKDDKGVSLEYSRVQEIYEFTE